MHVAAMVILGLCCVYLENEFRRARMYVLETLFALACAGVIAAVLMNWSFLPRALVWIGLVGCAAIGSIKLRNYAQAR
jgi:TM2 domain-containing membrane protein YozV